MSADIIELGRHDMFITYSINRVNISIDMDCIGLCPFIPPQHRDDHRADVIDMRSFFEHVQQENWVRKREKSRMTLFKKLKDERFEDDE